MSYPEMQRPRTRFEVSRLARETVLMSGQRTKASPSITLSVEYDHDDQDGALRQLEWVYEEAKAQIEDTRATPGSQMKDPPDTSWLEFDNVKGKPR